MSYNDKIYNARADLNLAIRNAIDEFSRETGIEPSSIDIRMVETTTVGDLNEGGFRRFMVERIDIDLSL